MEFPQWPNEIGSAKRIVSVKPSEFKIETERITLTGIPDLLFERPDGSFAIVYYKTAKYTGNQDQLMLIYPIQLNGYAYIAGAIELNPVKLLSSLF
jgi:RecB family exonuclease